MARPIWGEIQVWRERWGEIGPVVNNRPAFYIFISILGILLIPFDLTVNSQGMLKPEHSLNIVAYQPSQVERLPPYMGSRVEKGAPLIALRSPELLQKIHISKIKVSTLEKQFSTAGFSAETLRQQSVVKEQLDSANEELKGLIAERERLHPIAPFDGLIVDVEPDLFVGEWIPKGMALIRVIDDKNWVVDSYIEEADLHRLDNGNWGWFIPEAPGLPDVWLSIISIDRDASRILPDGPLGSTAGGQILVRPQNNKMYPERAVYRVRLRASSTDKIISTGHLRGRVVILAWPKSILGDLIRGSIATIMRESGF
ncbi:HlyD family efflux transporter periplasmic adaptor subunit [Polynucleobacter paneuropaeus]|nr:HlyD family efflux transporter periplasmic adaptor subunit [Polynucleobacter paneuropaeus]MBT8601128.1 HlyD family efflux transporter periplasmic adaptor subunit [Polynucleobacter paneuropaeus]